MRRIVKLVCICGRQTFGRIWIEKVLHQTIIATESRPEAREFAPEELC